VPAADANRTSALSGSASPFSDEVRVALRPRTAFLELLDRPSVSRRRLLLRRPVLFAFTAGCVVSMWTSGSMNGRLIADGIVSFAFIPLLQVVSLRAVYGLASRRVSFPRAVDLFFTALGPWFVWLLGFAALRCFLTPTGATAPSPVMMRAVELSVIPVIAWSAHIDLQFFRIVLQPRDGRSGRTARRDLIWQRAIGWVATLVYFLGYAAWPEIIGRIPS
jgi:hypothetical protein